VRSSWPVVPRGAAGICLPGVAPTAVLVDSDLPGTDGFALCFLAEQAAGFAGPVILMLPFRISSANRSALISA